MISGRAGNALVAAALLAGAVALSGCLSASEADGSPGRLAATASWRDAMHLDVTVRNVGGTPMPIGGVDALRLTGPSGSVPVHWSGVGPTLAPGETRTFDLHSMHMDDGTTGMTMDHAMAGTHMPMPPGEYTLRMGDASAGARLGR